MKGDRGAEQGSTNPKAAEGAAGLTVFYDGGCPLCRAEIGHYQACDGADRIAFVDVSGLGADRVAPGLDRAAALARFHVATSGGALHSGAEAFARLWRTLPGWCWLGNIVLKPGILPVAEFAYRAFLPVRPALQWLARIGSGRRP